MTYLGDQRDPPSLWQRVPLILNGYDGDVAVLTDISTGDELVEIVYRDFNAPPGRTPELRVMEFDFNNPPVVLGSASSTLLSTGLSYFSPRIESMSEYDPGGGMGKWQVAVSIYDGAFLPGGYRAFGFNEIASGATALSPLFNHLDAKSPCVAAGAGLSLFPTNIGSTQYTVGFFPRQHDTLYSRIINPLTGSVFGTDYYQVNHTSEPVTYNWESAKNYAISSSSNSGSDLLAAWYDSASVRYKQISPNSMSFKTIPTNIVSTAGNHPILAYPNPALDQLRIIGASEGAYTIRDATGKLAVQGQVRRSEAIDIRTLVPGTYFIHTQARDGKNKTLKFIKQ